MLKRYFACGLLSALVLGGGCAIRPPEYKVEVDPLIHKPGMDIDKDMHECKTNAANAGAGHSQQVIHEMVRNCLTKRGYKVIK